MLAVIWILFTYSSSGEMLFVLFIHLRFSCQFCLAGLMAREFFLMYRGHCGCLAVRCFVVLLTAHCWHSIAGYFQSQSLVPSFYHHGSRSGLSSAPTLWGLRAEVGWWDGWLDVMGGFWWDHSSGSFKQDVERSFCCCVLFRNLSYFIAI